jgi:hypothetical protein
LIDCLDGQLVDRRVGWLIGHFVGWEWFIG